MAKTRSAAAPADAAAAPKRKRGPKAPKPFMRVRRVKRTSADAKRLQRFTEAAEKIWGEGAVQASGFLTDPEGQRAVLEQTGRFVDVVNAFSRYYALRLDCSEKCTPRSDIERQLAERVDPMRWVRTGQGSMQDCERKIDVFNEHRDSAPVPELSTGAIDPAKLAAWLDEAAPAPAPAAPAPAEDADSSDDSDPE